MISALLLVLSCQLATAAFVAPPTMGRRASTAPTTRISMSADLESWLTSKAGVSSKFIGSIIAKCDEEMIGSVENLATLNEAGMLDGIFKPVVAAGIAAALGNSGPVAAATTSSSAQMPLKEVKHLLMLNSQQTWGSEAALRARLDLFTLQSRLNAGGQWDPASQSWNNVVPLTSLNVGQGSGFTVPAQPAEFGGAQWAPIAFATEEVVVAVAAPPAAVAPAAAPAPAPAPAPAAPAAPPAAPAGDKSTFTVTFKNPDGDQSFECPPDEYLLDATEELDNADDFADLPYACRAGSCSACAGKVVSGQVDTSACTFLTEDQKADGWVLTCTCKALSDVVIETHKEDDLY